MTTSTNNAIVTITQVFGEQLDSLNKVITYANQTIDNTLQLVTDKADLLQRVRNLHSATNDGRSCRECSRLVRSVTNGKGSAQYPCVTVAFLDGEL